jgi:hypothetical protein
LMSPQGLEQLARVSQSLSVLSQLPLSRV